MIYNCSVDFREWFWRKFEEWRKGTTKGPSAFARYLGVSQPLVSAWLNGDYRPRMDSITRLAEKYPDVYSVLGLSPPPDPLEGLPSEVRGAVMDIRRLLASTDPAEWGSEETARAVRSILERYGSRDTTIE